MPCLAVLVIRGQGLTDLVRRAVTFRLQSVQQLLALTPHWPGSPSVFNLLHHVRGWALTLTYFCWHKVNCKI